MMNVYLICFMISDALLSIGWVLGLIAIPFRSDTCSKSSIIAHVGNFVLKLSAIIIYLKNIEESEIEN